MTMLLNALKWRNYARVDHAMPSIYSKHTLLLWYEAVKNKPMINSTGNQLSAEVSVDSDTIISSMNEIKSDVTNVCVSFPLLCLGMYSKRESGRNITQAEACATESTIGYTRVAEKSSFRLHNSTTTQYFQTKKWPSHPHFTEYMMQYVFYANTPAYSFIALSAALTGQGVQEGYTHPSYSCYRPIFTRNTL